MSSYSKQLGFTLLELLLVVGIMAIIGGVMISSYGAGQKGSVKDNTEQAAVRHEINQIKKSVQRFMQDNPGVLENLDRNPADFSFLFLQGVISNWNVDYQLGWRGPYLIGGNSGLVDVGDDLREDGTGSIFEIDVAVENLVRGIPDPFVHEPITHTLGARYCEESTMNNLCVLDWRFLGQTNDDLPHDKYGRPYLLFDADNDHIRIISMGSNGRYDSAGKNCASNPEDYDDDVMVCLIQ